jgi:hypothetical protein
MTVVVAGVVVVLLKLICTDAAASKPCGTPSSKPNPPAVLSPKLVLLPFASPTPPPTAAASTGGLA